MKLELRPLPYSENALEPAISAKTVALHYRKHHAGYVHKTKELLGSKLDAYPSLESLILECDGRRDDVFDQAGQVWNHDFFWQSMRPPESARETAPPESIRSLIVRGFGSVEQLLRQLIARGEGYFGSGWLWLAMDGDELTLATTPNGRPLFADGVYPLLACDLWEHAYYLDYENRRHDFLEKYCTRLVNWDFAAARLARREKDAAHTAEARRRAAGDPGLNERTSGRPS